MRNKQKLSEALRMAIEKDMKEIDEEEAKPEPKKEPKLATDDAPKKSPSKFVDCSVCRGSGLDGDALCATCAGSGKVLSD